MNFRGMSTGTVVGLITLGVLLLIRLANYESYPMCRDRQEMIDNYGDRWLDTRDSKMCKKLHPDEERAEYVICTVSVEMYQSVGRYVGNNTWGELYYEDCSKGRPNRIDFFFNQL